MNGNSSYTACLLSTRGPQLVTASAQSAGLPRTIDRHRLQTWERRRPFRSFQQWEKTSSRTSVEKRWMGAARLWIARTTCGNWQYSSTFVLVHSWMSETEVSPEKIPRSEVGRRRRCLESSKKWGMLRKGSMS